MIKTMIYQEFMDAGYIIFGLHGVNPQGKCNCGNPNCTALYKHPVAGNWQYSPAWSDEQIDIMCVTRQLATGYGVLVKGLLVIDIDARNGGMDSYAGLLESVPEIAGAGLIVETGSGGGSKHLYFTIPDISLVQYLPDFTGIDFKSSGYVVGPGSMHISGNTYRSVCGSPGDIDAAPDKLLALLKKPNFYKADYNGKSVDISGCDVTDMLTFIANDALQYEEWLTIGMAVHHATNGCGYSAWCAWSSKSNKHDETEMEKRWHSFGKSANPVTLGTLTHYAEQGGWQPSVVFQSDFVFNTPAVDGLPFDISGVDLLRPPGFVGVLTEWINDQCRYPREHLAVAAALTSVGTIAGMRHCDQRDGVTSNLFTFCVAASGTGKEAVGQAITDICYASGISEAIHGGIKSEQEIIRNLLRNQAAFYTIDEVGFILQKIKNAQAGGVSYLESVIGILMSAYSKAGGTLPLGGDLKEQVRSNIMKELSGAQKKIDENEDVGGRYEQRIVHLEHQLQYLSQGLHRPFLSLIGYTTPENFNGLINGEAARSGFIGRSLIFQERNDNPKSKRRFRKRSLPVGMAATLSTLYNGGNYALSDTQRVEQQGTMIEVLTDRKADQMLEDALTWIEHYADIHMEKTGMTAVVRRGFEILSKLSLILAIPGSIRSAEHVRWAFVMMQRDMDDKISLTLENDTSGENQLMRKILNLITDKEGLTIGVLKNKLRQYKADDVKTALNNMQEKEYVIRVTTKPVGGGHKKEKWFKCIDTA